MATSAVAAYAARLHRSQLFIACATWLSAAAAHPWTRACARALRYAFALLTGEPYEDEQAAFSKRRLVANDAYRDRLLAPEIADLVDLSDALQLTIAQRKAFFRCFLHLDFMRRSGVSRAELLRYCGLRDTPAARVLLPGDGAFAVAASTHRSDEFHAQRWDVTQLLALAFSLCTMNAATLVDVCMCEISALANTPGSIEESKDGAETSGEMEETGSALAREIRTCLAFCYGVPSPVETKLGEFVCRAYSIDVANFQEIHEVASLSEVITLFPALVFPCVWTQIVIRRRVLGEATWSKLTTRRAELERMGLNATFASAAEIIEVANKYTTKPPVRWLLPSVGVISSNRYPLSAKTEADVQYGASPVEHSLRLTPRRVLPVESNTSEQSSRKSPQRIASTSTLGSVEDAWRVTADNVLATVHVWQELADGLSPRDGVELFKAVRPSMEQRTLSSESIERAKRWLIQQYGYQFTAVLLSKSSVCETGGDLVSTMSVRKQRRRAEVRYQKADSGLALVEDKGAYWKEYTDPLLKRVFYHNIRTGESRWEMPVTFEKKRPKQRRERRTTSSPVKHDAL